MPVAILSIERLRPGLYGWQVAPSAGIAHCKGTHTNLASCLTHALADTSLQSRLVEIIYCDMPMGTMAVDEVQRASKEIALQIKSLHSALLETA